MTALPPPLTAENPPVRPAIRYRPETAEEIRDRMLARLIAALPGWNPALVREPPPLDYAVLFAESCTWLCENLHFYQDCRANELFLRTACLPASLVDLTALIDYRPAPGASAMALQVFEARPGTEGTIPRGFRLVAEPPGQPPVLFETDQSLVVDARRNRLRLAGYDRSLARLNAPGAVLSGGVLLDRSYDGLHAGAPVVLTAPGRAPLAVPLESVTVEAGQSRLHWKPGPPLTGLDLPIADLTLLGAPRQAMGLLGRATADDLPAGSTEALVRLPAGASYTFPLPALLLAGSIQLAVRILSLSPVAGAPASVRRARWDRPLPISLRKSGCRLRPGNSLGLLGIAARGAIALALYIVAPGATVVPGEVLLATDPQGAERISVASITALPWMPQLFWLGLSEPLPRALRSVDLGSLSYLFVSSLPGDQTADLVFETDRLLPGTAMLTLDATYDGLGAGDLVALLDGTHVATREIADVGQDPEGRSVLTLTAPAGEPVGAGGWPILSTTVLGPFAARMRAHHYNRSEATLPPGQTGLTLAGAVPDLAPGGYLMLEGEGHVEGVRIVTVGQSAEGTVVGLDRPTLHAYPLADTVVYGNVVQVSHGELIPEEILGSGAPADAPQRFSLRRAPLALLPGDDGLMPALELFVGGEQWRRVESLAESGPGDHHYMLEFDAEGGATVRFGEDRHGAAPASGRDNIRARYRVGLGAMGNVLSGGISQMPTALAFVATTRNPADAGGGAGRESPGETRRRARTGIRALERAVALEDYAALALGFGGLAKARAAWGWFDGAREIVLTVVAAGSGALTPRLADALLAYLESRRSPEYRLRIRDFTPWPVRTELELGILAGFRTADVVRDAFSALAGDPSERLAAGLFHLDRRELGDRLALSEVYAAVEAVPGVRYARATVFRPEREPSAGAVRERIQLPPDALAVGGHPTDPDRGLLVIAPRGGLA